MDIGKDACGSLTSHAASGQTALPPGWASMEDTLPESPHTFLFSLTHRRGPSPGTGHPLGRVLAGRQLAMPTSVFPLPLCPHLCQGFTACFSPLRVRYTAQPHAQVWSGSASGEAARVLTSASGGNPAVTEACALGLAGPVTSNTAALESHRVCHRVHSLP